MRYHIIVVIWAAVKKYNLKYLSSYRVNVYVYLQQNGIIAIIALFNPFSMCDEIKYV